MIRKLPLHPKKCYPMGETFSIFFTGSSNQEIKVWNSGVNTIRVTFIPLNNVRTNFSKFCFNFKTNISPSNDWKTKGIALSVLWPPCPSARSHKRKKEGLYGFLSVIPTSSQKGRASCSWLKGFRSLTTLQPYSPASHMRWDGGGNSSVIPWEFTAVRAKSDGALCLRGLMGVGGNGSLHTNEVSKKYLA